MLVDFAQARAEKGKHKENLGEHPDGIRVSHTTIGAI
jgi:hypothetical protein